VALKRIAGTETYRKKLYAVSASMYSAQSVFFVLTPSIQGTGVQLLKEIRRDLNGDTHLFQFAAIVS
jgi:hypothetical protein